VEATARNPKIAEAQLLLAGLHEREKDRTRATERYRAVIAAAPANVTALNNLAFILAEQRDTTGEAVTLARRAASLAPQSPQVLDTLAWALHQSGDSASARAPIALALRAAPDAVEVLLHSALIDAALGELATAKAKLERALTLSPAIGSSDNVRVLREKLAAPRSPSTAKPAK
jgi:Tfp pilus assembly protein PilF